jgi:predicted metal-binding protein
MTRYEPGPPRHTWEIAKHDLALFQRDMDEIRDQAVAHGADFADLIEAHKVAVDERVTLKCRIPPCECYGRCLMDPPFSPTAEETAKVVARYKYGILIEVSTQLPEDYWELIQGDQSLCRLQYDDRALAFDRTVQRPRWVKLHELVMGVEREAHNRGYLFAVGYVASTCYLCYDEANPVSYCDTSRPCRRPYEARPSMEAAGMDVFSTYWNIGRTLDLASREKFSWSGLVLVV